MRLFQIVIIWALCLTSVISVQGAELMSADACRELLLESGPEYGEWQRASIKGKLRMDGLPVSPAVRIYMERDSLVVMSCTAPFVGEAVRIELTQDSVLMVNKLKKSYARMPLSSVRKVFPGTLGDLQDFLLGRVVICGHGPLSGEMADGLELYALDSGEMADEAGWETEPSAEGPAGWILAPASVWQPMPARYGYILDSDLTPLSMVVEMPDPEDFVRIDYMYDNSGTGYAVETVSGNRRLEALLQCEDARLDTSDIQSLDRIRLNGKYAEVSVRQLMKF